MQVYNTRVPFDQVAMDVLGALPVTKSGNRYALVISDYFTKWPEVIAIPNQEAETIAQVFVKEFVCRYGVPLELHTDQGKNFESILLAETLKVGRNGGEVKSNLVKVLISLRRQESKRLG